jgi:hypothetical protein
VGKDWIFLHLYENLSSIQEDFCPNKERKNIELSLQKKEFIRWCFTYNSALRWSYLANDHVIKVSVIT